MTPSVLKFKVTRAGLAALFNAQRTGVQAVFSHVAIGSGVLASGVRRGYQPSGQETQLAHEFLRAALGAGEKQADNTLLFGALLDGAGGGWIAEAGMMLSDGTLFAVWSEDPTVVQRAGDNGAPVYGAPLGYKTPGVVFALGAVVVFDGVDLQSLTLNIAGPLISVSWGGAPPLAENGVIFTGGRYRGVVATPTVIGVTREMTQAEIVAGAVSGNSTDNPYLGLAALNFLLTKITAVEPVPEWCGVGFLAAVLKRGPLAGTIDDGGELTPGTTVEGAQIGLMTGWGGDGLPTVGAALAGHWRIESASSVVIASGAEQTGNAFYRSYIARRVA
jgi:hypothetical protein